MLSRPSTIGTPRPLTHLLTAPAGGTHAHCRGCLERVPVSMSAEQAGWYTVHACTPAHAIEVNIRIPGAAAWAWRYVADAVAVGLLPTKETPRRGRMAG